MSKKRYYNDAYQTEFKATVVQIEPITIEETEQFAIILNGSYFYPESGGQPADHGRLGSHPIHNVLIRETDQAVLHITPEKPSCEAGEQITGQIDWSRRFDHMQQHTGQHILSRAFIELYDTDTVGFHLSADYCTIDLNQSKLSTADIRQAEERANQIIWENRPVHIRFVSHQQAAELPLRKRPPVASDQLRLVEISKFDLNACGGTHVLHTGEVGQIKIIKIEKRKKKLRLTFVCGARAWRDYEHKNGILTALTNELTTGQDVLLESIQKSRQELKQKNKQIKGLKQALLRYEAKELKASCTQHAGISWITKVYQDGELDTADLRPLINALIPKQGKTVALIALAGSKAQFLAKCDKQLPLVLETDSRNVPLFENIPVRGGADFVQVSGFSATKEQLEKLITDLKSELQNQVS